ncbi:nuclear transport factor 2 family protein [Nocardia bovistercoris]|uniref:Nuclear transport factor 2 family protein n=1 Tax=Nocardia bovistercoris TaxID=2785916 RepID=A0A931IDE7_9NOCA|nr:nuclear transport factor 2 family protein [Nocardia bovistercoris]MBH0777790.1 nuclear transport factor 2 family protein [Nocardia bovistercoris]
MTTDDFVRALYTEVDRRDADALGRFLHEDVVFRFGNAEPVRGRAAVIEANRAFFASIASMRHEFDSIAADGPLSVCEGTVHYERLDATTTGARFATFLDIRDGAIVGYRVYADITALR